MNGLDKIIAQILDDAKQESLAIQEKAAGEAETTLAAAGEKVKKLEEEQAKSAAQREKSYEERLRSSAALKKRQAILAAKQARRYILQADIEQAFVKVGIGAEKKSKVISEKEKKITAYHETGHAILFHELPDVGPVHTISIIPTGMGAAGYTMPLPEKDEMFNTKNKMLETIMVSLGGRIAEEIIFGDVTTGASQDIKQASAIARAMVTQYGMSEKLGMINYGSDDDEVFIGRDLAHTRSYGERVASDIDSEVKRIIDECYAKAKEIILAHEDILHKCAALLIEKEKIGQEEFDSLFAEGTEKPELE